MDEKTARKYRDAERLPSEQLTPRTWRTRRRPVRRGLAGGAGAAGERTEAAGVHALRLAAGPVPGRFPDSQRRTFERRVRAWRQRMVRTGK